MSTAKVAFNYPSLLGKVSLVSTLLDGSGIPAQMKDAIPKVPPDAVQISTTGKSRHDNMVEVVDFYQAVMERYRSFVRRAAQPRVLYFGCGWGRITRTFLSVTAAANIRGA